MTKYIFSVNVTTSVVTIDTDDDRPWQNGSILRTDIDNAQGLLDRLNNADGEINIEGIVWNSYMLKSAITWLIAYVEIINEGM
jgi:hypothetical protein